MGLRSQTPAMKMRAYMRAILFAIQLKSTVSKRRFIMNFKLLMDRHKHVDKSISNIVPPPTTHNPHHNIIKIPKIPSLLDSSSSDDQEWRELIIQASESLSQSDVEGISGCSAEEGEGSRGRDINIKAEEFIQWFKKELRKGNSEEFDGISDVELEHI